MLGQGKKRIMFRDNTANNKNNIYIAEATAKSWKNNKKNKIT